MSGPARSEAGPEVVTITSVAQRRRILVGVCVALMAVISSVTGLNVAQRQISVALGASQSDVLWMINIYAVTMAALLLPLGAVGDRWGRKPVLLCGLVVFGAASAVAGLAPSTEVMFVARFLSGVGAAMIMPVTLAVITSSFPDAERSKAIGVWTGVAAGGGIVGMYLSALLVDVASWRWLFVLPVVLVVVAVSVTVRSVPNSVERSEHGFDTIGSLTSVAAVVGLIWTLHKGPEEGWAAPATLVSLLVGVAGLVGFVLWERRQVAPLLDVRLFRDRGLASGSVTLLAVFGVQAGVFVVMFPYFQGVLGWSGLRSTVAMMPMALLMMVSSGVAPRVAGRVGPRSTMSMGILLGAVGLALMASRVSVDGGYRSVLPGILLIGLGMGMSMTPSTEAITSALPRGRQGVASALNDVTREFGTALGVALLGALLTAGYRSGIEGRLDGMAGLPRGSAETAAEGIANALAVSATLDDPAPLVGAAQASFVEGWQRSMWSGVAVLGVLCGFVLLRGPERTSGARSHPGQKLSVS